jgi:hypothetical protein
LFQKGFGGKLKLENTNWQVQKGLAGGMAGIKRKKESFMVEVEDESDLPDDFSLKDSDPSIVKNVLGLKNINFGKVFRDMPLDQLNKVSTKIMSEKNSARIIEYLARLIPEVNKLEDQQIFGLILFQLQKVPRGWDFGPQLLGVFWSPTLGTFLSPKKPCKIQVPSPWDQSPNPRGLWSQRFGTC